MSSRFTRKLLPSLGIRSAENIQLLLDSGVYSRVYSGVAKRCAWLLRLNPCILEK
jgi:hypothetical protein